MERVRFLADNLRWLTTLPIVGNDMSRWSSGRCRDSRLVSQLASRGRAFINTILNRYKYYIVVNSESDEGRMNCNRTDFGIHLPSSLLSLAQFCSDDLVNFLQFYGGIVLVK